MKKESTELALSEPSKSLGKVVAKIVYYPLIVPFTLLSPLSNYLWSKAFPTGGSEVFAPIMTAMLAALGSLFGSVFGAAVLAGPQAGVLKVLLACLLAFPLATVLIAGFIAPVLGIAILWPLQRFVDSFAAEVGNLFSPKSNNGKKASSHLVAATPVPKALEEKTNVSEVSQIVVSNKPEANSMLRSLLDLSKRLDSIDEELTNNTNPERLQELLAQKDEIDKVLLKLRKADQNISRTLEDL